MTFGDLTVEQAKRVARSSPPGEIPELLQQAIRAERFDLLRLLLEGHDADPNSPTPYGLTALHVAVEFYQADMVEYLCAHGASPNAQNPDGWTPLHVAVDIEADSAHQEDREPSVGLIRILLEAGADARLRDKKGLTPRDLAAEWGHDAAAQLLAEYEEREWK
jgi:ankyrin repeat protein